MRNISHAHSISGIHTTPIKCSSTCVLVLGPLFQRCQAPSRGFCKTKPCGWPGARSHDATHLRSSTITNLLFQASKTRRP